jgi:hypothetical protein
LLDKTVKKSLHRLENAVQALDDDGGIACRASFSPTAAVASGAVVAGPFARSFVSGGMHDVFRLSERVLGVRLGSVFRAQPTSIVDSVWGVVSPASLAAAFIESKEDKKFMCKRN